MGNNSDYLVTKVRMVCNSGFEMSIQNRKKKAGAEGERLTLVLIRNQKIGQTTCVLCRLMGLQRGAFQVQKRTRFSLNLHVAQSGGVQLMSIFYVPYAKYMIVFIFFSYNIDKRHQDFRRFSQSL